MDYRAGNISKEKYEYLYDEYNRKLEEIEVSSRIRAMQGKSKDGDGLSHSNLKEALRQSELEDQELINKFIVRNDKPKKPRRQLGNGAIIAIATLALLLAFAGGIGFGVFNFDFNANAISLFGQASISDSAFPVVVSNVTKNTTNYTSSNTYYNVTNYTSYSDDSGDDSVDYSEDTSKHSSSGSDQSSHSSSNTHGSGSSSSSSSSHGSGSSYSQSQTQ